MSPETTLKKLQYRIKFEKLIANITRSLSTSDPKKIDKAIQKAITAAGKFTGVDRTCVTLFSDDLTSMCTRFEWVDAGIKPLMQHLQHMSVKQYPWFMQQLLAKDTVEIKDVSKLPQRAAKEKTGWLRIGYKSLLLVNFDQDGKRAGFVCFDTFRTKKTWNKHDLELLQIVAGLIADALHRKSINQEIEYRLRFQDMIFSISKRFATAQPHALDNAIQQTIKEAGQFIGVDRTCVTLFSPDLTSMRTQFEWVAKGIKPLIKYLQHMSIKQYPWFMQQIFNENELLVPDINDLPKEAAVEQSGWLKIGYKSLLLVPIVQHNIRIGYICFDTFRDKKSWNRRDIDALHIIAELISQALERKEANKKIQNRLHFENMLFDISREFATVEPKQIDTAIQKAITMAGKFTGVDRTCVTLFEQDMNSLRTHFEWVDTGITPLIKHLQHMRTKNYPWFTQQLLNEKILLVHDISKLPKEAETEKQGWLKIGYKSLLLVPLIRHGKRIGFVCFDTFREIKSWDHQDIDALQILTELISQALERKLTHNALIKTRERFDALFDRSLDGIYITDAEARYLAWNPGAEKITGYHKAEVMGKTCCQIFDITGNQKENVKQSECTTLRAIHEKRTLSTDLSFNHNSHRKITIKLSVIPIFDDYDNLIGAMGIFSDISAQAKKEEILEIQANIDILTELHNRRSFDRTLPIEYTRATRYKRPLTALFIDIDDFKDYNDTYGHQEGDVVLKKLAHVLQDHVRIPDYIFRYGGEEFVVLLPETTEKEAIKVAGRIRTIFSEVIFKPEKCAKKKCDIKTLQKTISIGVAKHNLETSAHEFINHADKAMYYAKQHGKNRVCTYDEIK